IAPCVPTPVRVIAPVWPAIGTYQADGHALKRLWRGRLPARNRAVPMAVTLHQHASVQFAHARAYGQPVDAHTGGRAGITRHAEAATGFLFSQIKGLIGEERHQPLPGFLLGEAMAVHATH